MSYEAGLPFTNFTCVRLVGSNPNFLLVAKRPRSLFVLARVRPVAERTGFAVTKGFGSEGFSH